MSRKSDFSVQNNVVSVCCSYLSMVFPYIGNAKYPHGRTDQQHRFKSKRKISKAAKIALRFTERPLTTVVALCMLSVEAARSFDSLGMILDQRFLKSTNTERIGQGRFSRLLLFFWALVSLVEYSSLALFAGVQDVVDLVFQVSIKWGAALLVHHFVVRLRLIESQALVDFSSVSFNYSVYARSWPTSSPGCFSLALEVGHPTSNPKQGIRDKQKGVPYQA